MHYFEFSPDDDDVRTKTETINYVVTNDVFLKWPLAIMSKQQR